MFENGQPIDAFGENFEYNGRIWDEVDYVVSPSGTDQFFVMTNVILTPNQIRKGCPEDYQELPTLICGKNYQKSKKLKPKMTSKPKIRHTSKLLNDTIKSFFLDSYVRNVIKSLKSYTKIGNRCKKDRIKSYKSHGIETGRCVRGDRINDDPNYACEIKTWCPVEQDTIPNPDTPLISGTENFTVLIKNTISFPVFGAEKYHRNNMPNGFCVFEPEIASTWLCPIFRLGDIVSLAGGNQFLCSLLMA